jgi:thiopurine S-methyltransferase
MSTGIDPTTIASETGSEHAAGGAAFWHDRWAAGQIGFHEGAPNADLQAHWNYATGSVLVPLCGKTLDLGWLAARGHTVTGVELSAVAIAAWFDEASIIPTRRTDGVFTRWEGGGVTILEGDFFAVDGHFDLFWDRAAMIALPPALRERYARRLRHLAPRGLLSTLAYDQARRDGPPFAVPDHEVMTAHPDAVRLDHGPLPDARFDPIGGATRSLFRVG